MKKCFLMVVIPFLLLWNCKKNMDHGELVRFSGIIKNTGENMLLFYKNGEKDTIHLDTTGIFRHELEIPDEGFYYIRHGSEWATLYLIKGSELHFEADYNRFDESVRYSGKLGKINNYIAKTVLLEDSVQLDYNYIAASKKEEALTIIDSVKALQIEILESTLKNNRFNRSFISNELSRINSQANRARIYVAVYGKNEVPFDDSDYFSFLEQPEINNQHLINLTEYKNYIELYLDFMVEKDKNKSDSDETEHNSGKRIKAAVEHITNEYIRNKLITSITREHIYTGDIDSSDIVYGTFKENSTDTAAAIKIGKLFHKRLQLVPGNTAPEFTLENHRGNPVSLSDFRGKYVYLDFWATWCGPCIRELPYFNRLKEDYKNKDIEFVSISLDNTKEPWLEMIEDKKLSGHLLHADDAFGSDVSEDYMIYFIPKFVIIDKEGKIKDFNPPNPSHPILRDLFDTFL